MKKITKSISVNLIIILILTMFSGCSTNTQTKEAAADTTIYVDCVGREVSVPNEIDSVAALYTVVGHVLIMLNKGDLITSCSRGLKRDTLILNMVPKINDIAMPKSGGETNIEELLKSKPDIIFIDVATYWDQGQMEIINKLRTPYYVIDFNSIQEEMKMVTEIAKMTHSEEAGQKYIDFYQNALNLADKIVATIPDDEKIRVYHSINEAVRTSPKNTLTAEWLERAGCINVALNADITQDEDKYYTTLEDILMWNPQIILVNEPDTYSYITSMKAWENIDAVKNNHVYQLPIGISRWGHATSLETPLAILWTLKTLYPKYSEAIDLNQLTKSFYKDLFNYDLSDDEIKKILSGYDMRKAKNLE